MYLEPRERVWKLQMSPPPPLDKLIALPQTLSWIVDFRGHVETKGRKGKGRRKEREEKDKRKYPIPEMNFWLRRSE